MKTVYDELNCRLLNPKQITGDRLSIVNGKEDFTEYGPDILMQANAILEAFESREERGICDISECIIKIILAEVYYQADDCYNALVMTNSALAFLEKKENVEVWAVAKYIQLCIMMVTGQLKAIFPLVDSMKEDVMASGNEQLIANYEALVIWCALYDNDWKLIDDWMENKAPSEFGNLELKDALAGFVKARVYFVQRKYYSLITLLQSLEKTLKENGRVMQLCELYMLMAMAFYADDHKKEAFEYFGKIVGNCAQRGFVRLLADEGEIMYHIIGEYMELCEISDDDEIRFLKKARKASKNVAIVFPNYLKNRRLGNAHLTRKEQEIYTLLENNRTNPEIANLCGCSINTVKYHIKNIYKKLDVNSRKEVAASLKNKGEL